MSEPIPDRESGAPDCDELREMIPDYVVGGIDASEKARIEAWLKDCPSVAEELRAYLKLSQALLADTPPVQPPAHLHDRLMAAVSAAPASAPVRQPPSGFTNRRLWAALALAATFLLVVSNVYWFTRVSELGDLRQDVVNLLNEERYTLAALGAGHSQRVELKSTDSASQQVYATVLWNAQIDRALLYSDQLPALPAGQTYQLWLIAGSSAPVSGGVFEIDPQGAGVLIFQPPQQLSQYDTLAISTEPVPGSTAPTTAPLAAGKI